jgi:redox-sensitive bicupin YhaK (pirin superfamily)
MTERKVRIALKSTPVVEGAGVHLQRVFGYNQVPDFDPFLMLDDFRNTDTAKFRQGFPWHPHRGIETITYILEGDVEHQDSLGNKGIISAGDVQWMTAGNGIIHQEMPLGTSDGRMMGFQLWANLPASRKMMNPRYRDVKKADIPIVKTESGVIIRVICGVAEGVAGPVREIVTEPLFLDIEIPAGLTYHIPVRRGFTVFAYCTEGCFFTAGNTKVNSGNVVLYEDGDHVSLNTTDRSARLLFLSGKPLGEPVAWGGPIVMNTKEELDTAFEEYQSGTFLKNRL